MKSDKEIKDEFRNLEEKSFKEIEAVLRKYDYNTQNMLASFVASICDVDLADMLSSSDKLHLVQPRWLFWYAYRYMTNETYERISERTALGGHKFTLRAVASGIDKIGKLIDAEDLWKARWFAIRKMIKLKQEATAYAEEELSQKYRVTIQVPKGVEVELKKDKE